MKKSPEYTIRSKPKTEPIRSGSRAPDAPHQPIITLNTAKVEITRTPSSEDAEGETEGRPVIEPIPTIIPELTIEDMHPVRFAPGRKSLLLGKKWTGYTFTPPKNLLRLSAVAGGAVMIGLLLGYVVLQTFTAEAPDSASKVPVVTGQALQPPPQGKAEAQKNGNADLKTEQVAPAAPVPPAASAPKTKTLTVTLPVVPLYVVQGGVFSTKEGAQQERAAFQQKGWPSHMEEDAGKHVLFLGASASRDDALSLAEAYRASKQEVYIKEKSLPAGTVTLTVPDALPQGEAEQIQRLGEAQAQLFRTVSFVIGGGFKEGKIPQAQLDKMLAEHRDVLQRGRSAVSVLPEQPKALLQKSLNEMTTAVTTLQQFARQPNKTYLWQSEDNMLRFVSLYRQWQQSLAQ